MTTMFEGPTGRQRLLRTYEATRTECFDDLLYCCAATIEDSLIMGGAKPGEDYRALDLYQMAMPLALARSNDATMITTGVPSTHPSAGNSPPPRLVDPDDEVLAMIVDMSGPEDPGQNGNWVTRKHLNQKLKQTGWDLKSASKVIARLNASGLIMYVREPYHHDGTSWVGGDSVCPTQKGRKRVRQYRSRVPRGAT